MRDRDRLARVKELFGRALSLVAADRPAFLDAECAGDPELKREVLDLIALVPGELRGTGTARLGVAPELEIPGFRGLELLVAGGSGVIYRARQENPPRDVALKLLRFDTATPEFAARLRREAAILGSLNHPCIAKVYGAGIVDLDSTAQPWIAMEFVDGCTLDEARLEARLGIRALLEFFRTLCLAVGYAHGKGIVHRDLKPKNVMVDEAGLPKVLDFGVARTLTETSLATAERTRTGTMLGTLAYMAPEQARGETQVDARADVYALGTMLHEALARELPVPLGGLTVLRGVRAVCEREPTRIRRIRPDLPADLEAILLKALEKDAARRYADAGALAEDLSRLLAHRPVIARRPTAAYLARKFVRRNLPVVTSAAVILVALSASLVLALRSLRDVRAQQEVTSDTLDLFAKKLVDLSPQLGFGESERDDLEEVLARIDAQLKVDPGDRPLRATAARELYEIASLDQARQDYRSMLAHLERARTIREELAREDPGDLDSWTHLSQIYAKTGEALRDSSDRAGWETWTARALEVDERLVREHPDEAEYVEDLGWSLERMMDAASQQGDKERAGRIALRRLEDAEKLVRREPENWKYLFNLSRAEYFAAATFADRQDLSTACRHAEESVRYARRVCDLQPRRRDFLYWFAQSCRSASHHASCNGDAAAARRFAKDAIECAEEVAIGDPGRDLHLDLLRDAAKEYARLEVQDGRSNRLPEIARRLRRVVCLGRQQAPASEGLKKLAEAADEIETPVSARQ